MIQLFDTTTGEIISTPRVTRHRRRKADDAIKHLIVAGAGFLVVILYYMFI